MDVPLHLRTAYGLTFLMFMSPTATPYFVWPDGHTAGQDEHSIVPWADKHLVLKNSGEVQHVSTTPSHSHVKRLACSSRSDALPTELRMIGMYRPRWPTLTRTRMLPKCSARLFVRDCLTRGQ